MISIAVVLGIPVEKEGDAACGMGVAAFWVAAGDGRYWV